MQSYESHLQQRKSEQSSTHQLPAKEKKSLNDLLDSEPSVLPDLTGMLLRFREYKYAFQADIKKAFFISLFGQKTEYFCVSFGQMTMVKYLYGD